MFKSWRLGQLFGFPVEINLSFILLLGVALYVFGGIGGIAVVALLFASVLLHELGHAVVARRLGAHVHGIEMSFFGGAAKMSEIPRAPAKEIAIAAAGPAVSVLLGGIGLALGLSLHSWFFLYVGWINMMLAAFNLIPALPMDGGRILRAVLSRRMTHLRATEVAVKVSRVAAVAFGVLGVLGIGSFQLILLAPLLWMMASRELEIARAQHQWESGAMYGNPMFRVREWPPRW